MTNKIIILASSLLLASCGEEDVTPVGPKSGESSTPITKNYTSDPVWNVVAVPLSTADGSAASPYSYNTTIKDLKDPSITYWIHVDSGPNILDRVDDGRGIPTGTTHEDSTRVFFTFGAKYLPDEAMVTNNGFFKYDDIVKEYISTFSHDRNHKISFLDTNVTLQRWGRWYRPDKYFYLSNFGKPDDLKKMCPERIALHGIQYPVRVSPYFQRPKSAKRDTSYPVGVIPRVVTYCPNEKQIHQIDSGYIDIPGMRYVGDADLLATANLYWKCSDSLVFSVGVCPISLWDSAGWNSDLVPTQTDNPNFAKVFKGSQGGYIFCTVDSKYAD